MAVISNDYITDFFVKEHKTEKYHALVRSLTATLLYLCVYASWAYFFYFFPLVCLVFPFSPSLQNHHNAVINIQLDIKIFSFLDIKEWRTFRNNKSWIADILIFWTTFIRNLYFRKENSSLDFLGVYTHSYCYLLRVVLSITWWNINKFKFNTN